MAIFTGQLNSNEIFASIYNMIIRQEVFADNIYDTKASLVNLSRVDGGLYGDTVLYYSTDVLKSYPWGGDSEAENLLALDRPEDPEVQAIELNRFRQIRLTVDNYLSKRAWGTEGAFSSFNNIMLGWIRDTKRVYDSTLFNTYLGTAETAIGNQTINVALPAEPSAPEGGTVEEVNIEAYNRLTAQAVSTRVADLMVELEDVTRDYNDYGNLRSYNRDSLVAVWNASYANKIRRNDLPTIFNKDSATPDKFAEYTLPQRYFGVIDTTGGTTVAGNITIRSLIETDYTVSGVKYHVFPGDLLPGQATYGAGVAYREDPTIMFKLIHKKSIPYMSSFEAGTSFFNPRSLTENHYLTWGHNDLEYLKNYPMITVRGIIAQ